MSEQQYQCPVCNQQYTQFTARLHAGCGVVVESTVESIVNDEPAIASIDVPVIPTESPEVESSPEPIIQTQEPAPIAAQEPKKRGPKPRAK